MILRTQHGRARLVASLRQGAIAFGAVYVLIAVGLGGEALYRNVQSQRAEHQDRLVQQEIQTTRAEHERAKNLKVSGAPTDLSSIGRLQSTIERLASEQHCSVTEFRASTDVTPYLSRFSKTTAVSGWGQVETEVSLSGSAKAVAATLATLSDQDVPFEFDSLELSRDQVDDMGDATITGHATLRVLIKTDKGTT